MTTSFEFENKDWIGVMILVLECVGKIEVCLWLNGRIIEWLTLEICVLILPLKYVDATKILACLGD